jgi:hypothetical protein
MGKAQRRLLPPHLDLHLEVLVPKKKELLLQQQEDGESQNTFSWTGWMEKASQPQRPLLYVISTSLQFYFFQLWIYLL